MKKPLFLTLIVALLILDARLMASYPDVPITGTVTATVPSPLPILIPSPLPVSGTVTATVPSPLPILIPSPLPVSMVSPLPVVTVSPLPVLIPSPLPVLIPSPLPVLIPSPLPVLIPSPLPVLIPSPLPILIPSPLPVSVVSPLPVTVVSPLPVTVVSPLPVVAAATLAAETTKVIGTVNIAASQTIGIAAGSAVIGHIIADSGSTTAVTGNVAVTLAAGAASIGKAEDVASADADVGVGALAVRKATPANTSGSDGDYEFLQISAGRLWTSAVIDTALPAGTNGIGKLTSNAGVTIGAVEIAAAQTLSTVTTVGAVTAITNALPTGSNAIGKLAANSGVDIGDVDVTSIVPGTGATNQGKAEDAAHTTGDTGVMMLGVRTDPTTTASTSANTDYSAIAVDHVGAVPIAAHPGRYSCFVPLTTTATTQCQAAPAAGLRNYVTSLQCSNGAATVQGVDVVFGTGSNCATGITALTHKYQMGTVALTTSPFLVSVNYGDIAPLVPTAANAICLRPTAGTAFGCTITGFIAP